MKKTLRTINHEINTNQVTVKIALHVHKNDYNQNIKYW